jgi:SWI/SNF-related matrix-associated actin-dependent regulator 1 of chromatin subfamily A
VTVTLWPHQRRAAELATERNCLLAHEPGCGKTFVAAEVIRRMGGRGLYLCPASLRWQVADELRRYLTGFRVQVVASGNDALDADADVVVVSYDLAAREWVWRRLYGVRWGALILDEAHFLKNRRAGRTRAVYGAMIGSSGALWRRADRVVAMTGTPILNDPSDLWTHYSRLFPDAVLTGEGKPLTYAQWVERFCIVRNTGFGDQIVGGRNLDELAQCLTGYVDRVRKRDVLADLPPLLVDHLPLECGTLVLGDDAPMDAVLELTRLTQDGRDLRGDELAALEPALATIRRRVGLLKARATADLIQEELDAGVPKVVCFGLHPDALTIAAQRLTAAGVAVEVVTGKTPGPHRDAAVRRFSTDANVRVFLGQLYATGVGLNLQAADRVVVMEPAWTPAINEQALARCHRAGQRNTVRATFVSLKGSLDDSVVRALARKARLTAEIIDRKTEEENACA